MKKWQKIVGASLLSLATLAGCGTNGGNQTDDSTNAGGEEGETTYTIGISQFVEHPSLDAATKGFKAALEENDVNVTYDFQNAQADMNNTQTIAQNLVSNNVDLIFGNATQSTQAAVQQVNKSGKEIPVVFTSVSDPVGPDIVQSMDEPGGVATGTTDLHPEAIPNTITFIAEQMDDVENVGFVYNAGEENSVAQIKKAEEAMEGTGLKAVKKSVSTSAEVKQASEAIVGQADVFYIITDNTVVSALESVIAVAEENDMPMFVGELDSVKRGGFAAYGFEYYDIGYTAGEKAAEILTEGKAPSEIPVQYPQNLKLLINKQAAENMGIELKDEWSNLAEYYESEE